jgi:hypothetical protein
MEEHVFVLPLASVTVSTAELLPIVAQPKFTGETDIELIEQLSVERLFTAIVVRVATPELLSERVTFLQTAFGLIESTTETTAEQECVFPELSATVRVTVLLPACAQLNGFGVTVRDEMMQLSLEPLSTCAPVTVTVPPAPIYAVVLWQSAAGLMVSRVVMMAVQVFVLPLLSVTISVTLLAPN